MFAETLSASTGDKPVFHVLALSGGGYRSLYTATVLQELEAAMGAPLASHFDLICGTSAGGLLALGLAAEMPAADLKAVFEEQGSKIFDSRGVLRRLFGFWATAKHSNTGLRDVLTDKFKDLKLGDLKHRVLIPAVSYSTGLGQFFKTPHHKTFELDHQLTAVEVAMATAAAPAYFPLFRNKRGVFADGGLVGNAPGFFGLHEVRTFLAPNLDATIRVMAVGTMSVGSTMRGNAYLDRGISLWGGDLFKLVISAQESSVNYMLRQSLGDNYFQIDDQATPDQSKDIKALDRVTVGSTNTLLERGSHAAQKALGDPRFQAFRTHLAAPPTFFHGPNKNSKDI